MSRAPRFRVEALAVSLAVHLLVFAWPLRIPDDGARDMGSEGLTVSVGLAGQFVASVPTRREEPVAPEPKTEPKTDPKHEAKHEPKTESKHKPVAKTRQLAKPMLTPTIIAEPIARPVATANPAPVDEPASSTRPESSSEPEQVTTSSATPAAGSSKPLESPAIAATGVGERIETGGDPAARSGYLAQIKARIAREKRYPRAARRDGATGVVTVAFTISRSGALLAPRIVATSGDERLDQAALDMLARASPFPPLPSAMGVRELALSLPVEFALNNKPS